MASKQELLFDAIFEKNLAGIDKAFKPGWFSKVADVNAFDERGYRTPLMAAAVFATPKIVNILIERGADVNQGALSDEQTALMRAALSDNVETLSTLIEKGAAIDASTTEGNTALMYAAKLGNIGVVRRLIEAGCDINLTNEAGNVAMDFASHNQQYGVAKILQEMGSIHCVRCEKCNALARCCHERNNTQLNSAIMYTMNCDNCGHKANRTIQGSNMVIGEKDKGSTCPYCGSSQRSDDLDKDFGSQVYTLYDD